MENAQLSSCPQCTENTVRKVAHKLVRLEITKQDGNTRAVTRQLVVNCQMNDHGGKAELKGGSSEL